MADFMLPILWTGTPIALWCQKRSKGENKMEQIRYQKLGISD